MKRIIAVAIAIAACGPVYPKGGGTGPGSGTADGSGSGSAAPVAQTGSPGVFALGELKFYLGDDLGLQLHADGLIEENRSDPGTPPQWVPLGKITTDGRMFTPDGNQVGAWQPDGSFRSSRGEAAPFKFEGEELVVEGKHLSIDAQGILRGGSDTEKVLHVDGTTDAGSRRAALFVLALAFSGDGEDKGGSGAPPPAP